ncbi:MAG: family 16 glycosylhydrolase [Bacteroidales bacterium]
MLHIVKNKSLLFFYSILFFFMLIATKTYTQPGSGWELVFEDEFTGNQLDESKWNYNYTWGRTHNHRAYMHEDQVKVEDGKLKITAIDQRHPDAPDGTDHYADQFGYLSFDYTSGAVNTNGKFNFTYGYVEGRFKMSGNGTWPAFWTLNGTGEWPPEIDILEVPHSRTNHHFYYHYGPDWQNEESFGGQHNGVDKSAGFHNYAVEWGPDYMYFYFDGQRVGSYNNRDCTQGNNMYLIINLAVGGWAGDPSETDVFPSTYECEWVRVWQRDLNAGNWDLEDGELGQWGAWNDVSVTHTCSRSGNYGLQLSGSPASSERLVEVKPNTTYILGGWGKLSANSGYTVLGVKNYGGDELRSQFTETDWQNRELTFTTGADNTTARIYFYQSDGTGVTCGDDFYLIEAVEDCNGVVGGDAYLDYCGNCVGGNTGNEPCDNGFVEAEDLCYFDGVIEADFEGYSGESYVNIDMSSDADIRIPVYSDTNSDETVVIRYANGGNTDRDCKLLVNGVLQNPSVSFVPTGSWANWHIISTPVSLVEGYNTISLISNQDAGSPNFDLFSVTNINSYETCAYQTIHLTEGWNLLSFYVDSQEDMLAELTNAGVTKIKSADAFYVSTNPPLLNSIHNIETNVGYLMYATNDSTITFFGIIDEDIDYTVLRNGWNLYGIPTNTEISDFIEKTNLPIKIIKDFDGFFEQSLQEHTLNELEQGKAYFIFIE